MKEGSTIVGLPVVPFNQAKLADVCQYLDYLQDFLNSVTQEVEQTKLKVPLFGDLLGRERVTGAKRVRMGCDEPMDCYENITEAPGLWHAKQAYLKVQRNQGLKNPRVMKVFTKKAAVLLLLTSYQNSASQTIKLECPRSKLCLMKHWSRCLKTSAIEKFLKHILFLVSRRWRHIVDDNNILWSCLLLDEWHIDI